MNVSEHVLNVAFAFDPGRKLHTGRLALDGGIAVFEYAQEAVARKLTVNPHFGSPTRTLIRAERRPFAGLHGVFADSLPDAWGTELMRRRVRAGGGAFAAMTPLDKLALVGSGGMGALVYEPDYSLPSLAGEGLDIDLLAEQSLVVLEGRQSDALEQLERLGGSSGGARPKIFVEIDADGRLSAPGNSATSEPWIVKFRSSQDRRDSGPLEAAYADMARASGLDVAPSRLIPSKANAIGHFATKRFDRTSGGRRLHFLSLAGLLDLDWSAPTIDYGGLLTMTRRVTNLHADVEDAFRRMVFNVVAGNRDDHAKQHAFLMSPDGAWRLSPSYDLTPSNGPGGEHYLAVKGYGAQVPRSAIDELAKDHGIRAATVRGIVDDVLSAATAFQNFAKSYAVTKQSVREIEGALRQNIARCAG